MWLVRRYVGAERYRIVQLGIADDFEEMAVSYEDAQRLAYEHRFESEADEPRFELTVTEAVARFRDLLYAALLTGSLWRATQLEGERLR
jgi:hypothetical protein